MAGNSFVDRFRIFRRPIIGSAVRSSRGSRGAGDYPERGAHPLADYGGRRFRTPGGRAPLQHVPLKSCLVLYRGPVQQSADELSREIGPGVQRSPAAAAQGDSAPLRRGRLPNCNGGRGIAPKLADEIIVTNGQVIIAPIFWNVKIMIPVIVKLILCPG
jgi:hypothetical protein